jgi:hypothetical protein
MGSFLRADSLRKPVEPWLDVYELDTNEPCVLIDFHGVPWFQGFKQYEEYDDESDFGEIKQSSRVPEILFADIPVMVHTAYGFSIAPLSEASENTGPIKSSSETPSTEPNDGG